jgi:hypothetical protein
MSAFPRDSGAMVPAFSNRSAASSPTRKNNAK